MRMAILMWMIPVIPGTSLFTVFRHGTEVIVVVFPPPQPCRNQIRDFFRYPIIVSFFAVVDTILILVRLIEAATRGDYVVTILHLVSTIKAAAVATDASVLQKRLRRVQREEILIFRRIPDHFQHLTFILLFFGGEKGNCPSRSFAFGYGFLKEILTIILQKYIIVNGTARQNIAASQRIEYSSQHLEQGPILLRLATTLCGSVRRKRLQTQSHCLLYK